MRKFILNIFSTLLTVYFLSFASFDDETSKVSEINIENNNSVWWEENDGIWYVKASRSGTFLYES